MKQKLKSCPYCGGKIKFEKNAVAPVVSFELDFNDKLEEILNYIYITPKCKQCKTEYPSVNCKSFVNEIENMLMNKILEEWKI